MAAAIGDLLSKGYAGVKFLCKLLALYDTQPFSVSSWIRTPQHNAAVGGDPNSLHVHGLAADLVPDNHGSIKQLAEGARAVGLHYEENGDHLHVQLYPKGEPGAA